VTHYVPLHSALAGRKYARASGELPATDRVGDTLLRLPLFHDLAPAQQDRVVAEIHAFYGRA